MKMFLQATDHTLHKIFSHQKSKSLLFEPLEERALLAVSAADFDALKAAYPDLGLASNMSAYNVIEITAEELTETSLSNAFAPQGNAHVTDLDGNPQFVGTVDMGTYEFGELAEYNEWIGPNGGNWFDPQNWSYGDTPTAFDKVLINAGQTVVLAANGRNSIKAESILCHGMLQLIGEENSQFWSVSFDTPIIVTGTLHLSASGRLEFTQGAEIAQLSLGGENSISAYGVPVVLKGLREAIGVQFYTSTSMALPDLQSVTATLGEDGIFYGLLAAHGSDAAVVLPELTETRGITNNPFTIQILDGARASLPKMQTLKDVCFYVRSSTLDLSSVIDGHLVNVKFDMHEEVELIGLENVTKMTGGEIRFLNTGNEVRHFIFSNLNTMAGVNIMAWCTELSFPALSSYFASDDAEFYIDAIGSVLDFPILTQIGGNENSSVVIHAYRQPEQGKIFLPNLVSTEQVHVHLRASNLGSFIDVSRLVPGKHIEIDEQSGGKVIHSQSGTLLLDMSDDVTTGSWTIFRIGDDLIVRDTINDRIIASRLLTDLKCVLFYASSSEKNHLTIDFSMGGEFSVEDAILFIGNTNATNEVHFVGTDRDDSVTFDLTSLTCNSLVVECRYVANVVIDGREGENKLKYTGAEWQQDNFEWFGDRGRIFNRYFSFEAFNMTEIFVDGLGGNDTAKIIGPATNGVYSMGDNNFVMQAGGYHVDLRGFNRIDAFADGHRDKAYVYGKNNSLIFMNDQYVECHGEGQTYRIWRSENIIAINMDDTNNAIIHNGSRSFDGYAITENYGSANNVNGSYFHEWFDFKAVNITSQTASVSLPDQTDDTIWNELDDRKIWRQNDTCVTIFGNANINFRGISFESLQNMSLELPPDETVTQSLSPSQLMIEAHVVTAQNDMNTASVWSYISTQTVTDRQIVSDMDSVSHDLYDLWLAEEQQRINKKKLSEIFDDADNWLEGFEDIAQRELKKKR